MTSRAAASSPVDRAAVEEFATDVRYYLSLTPPQLPSRYLYDDVGSALFEAICQLPWYSITRAEKRLLVAHRDEIFRRLPSLGNVIELGPGSGEKLALLLESPGLQLSAFTVHLIDVSPAALAAAARTVGEDERVRLVTHQATYHSGLRDATAGTRGRTLVTFLGSNIGNFDPPGATAFLHNVRGSLRSRDVLLLGIDLVKPRDRLLLAYDDPLGVTAAFNRNLLVRINRELGATIDIEGFAHRAVWNEAESRVEMHLVARSPQTIRIPRAHATIRLHAGDIIWTESSYKYAPEGITELLQSAGFAPTAHWIDQDDRFALTMAEAT